MNTDAHSIHIGSPEVILGQGTERTTSVLCEMARPNSRAHSCVLFRAEAANCQSEQERCRIIAILRLAGAVSITSRKFDIHVDWPDATPWLVIVKDATTRQILNAWLQDEALAEMDGDLHLVTLASSQFDGIDAEDVQRAIDIQRRKRILKAGDVFGFSADDAFVQHVRLRTLRVLQRALEESPAASLLKARGRPLLGPSEDSLLFDGPALGCGEECDEFFGDMVQAAMVEVAK